MRGTKFILLAVILATSVGCSGLVESTRKNLLGDKSPRNKVKQQPKWVSKEQYDDLLSKYKNLNDKYQNLKEERLTNKKSFDQLDEMAASKTKNTEAIDVFGDKGLAKKTAPVAASSKVSINKNKFEEELDYYLKGVALLENGKNDEAFKVFQFVEASKVKQLRVRAKKKIGDHYLTKKQYDLALQVYESIIREYAFSGLVIPSLSSAVECTKQLGLTDKKLKYESILRDFFEVQV